MPNLPTWFYASAVALSMFNEARAQESAKSESLISQAFGGGKLSLFTRYRYEVYSQESSASIPISANAVASTLRIALAYQTKPLYGLNAFVEFAGVEPIGHNEYRVLNVSGQSGLSLPIISDPSGEELNQYYLAYESTDWRTTFKAGRQEITLGNGRFVSAQPWRQHHERFDAVSVESAPTDRLSFFYAFATRVYRVISPKATDGILNMTANMANARYRVSGIGSLTGYVLLLNEYSVPANATKTFGAKLEGPYHVNSDVDLLYAGELARQTNYASNPNHVDESYYAGELGAAFRKIALKAQYSVREAKTATDIFNTPLTGPWDGWVEKFLNNAALGAGAFGLETLSLSLCGPVPALRDTTAGVTAYDYRSNAGSAHYGKEIDAGAEHRFDSNLTLGWRFGKYFADRLFTDSLRTSGYLSYSF